MSQNQVSWAEVLPLAFMWYLEKFSLSLIFSNKVVIGTEVLTTSSLTSEEDDWQPFHNRELVKQDKYGCSVDVCSKGWGGGAGANRYCLPKRAEDHLSVQVSRMQAIYNNRNIRGQLWGWEYESWGYVLLYLRFVQIASFPCASVSSLIKSAS